MDDTDGFARRGGDGELPATGSGRGSVGLQAISADCHSSLRGIVRARLASLDEQSVEDALQETLLALHAKRHTWQQDQPVLPWIYAIARYKAIDLLRHHGGRSVELPIEDVVDQLEAADRGPERDMDVATAVALLEGRTQQVVRAVGVEGVSVRETGSRLGISENAVRVAFHRGLSQLVGLRQRLTGERGDDEDR